VCDCTPYPVLHGRLCDLHSCGAPHTIRRLDDPPIPELRYLCDCAWPYANHQVPATWNVNVDLMDDYMECNEHLCMNGGIPNDATMQCVCPVQYDGDLCERIIQCENQGVWQIDHCECTPEWEGVRCDARVERIEDDEDDNVLSQDAVIGVSVAAGTIGLALTMGIIHYCLKKRRLARDQGRYPTQRDTLLRQPPRNARTSIV